MDLIIVGAGSVGGHIALNLENYTSNYDLLGFVDDDPKKQDMEVFGYKVLGPIEKLQKRDNLAVVVGIAFPKVKFKITEKLKANKGLTFPALISNNAWISKGTSIGEGCIVYPGVTINYGCDIQDFVVINMNCAIGHNCSIGMYSSLAPGVNLAGHSQIGERVDIGIGAATRQNIRIGNDAIVGGQSMVVKNVSDDSIVRGVPGKAY